jgi:hypothetical protein
MKKYYFFTPNKNIPKGILFWVYHKEESKPVETIFSDKVDSQWNPILLQFYDEIYWQKNTLTHFGVESDDDLWERGMDQEEALTFISQQ